MKERIEILSTVLLALAAVAIAWSGYQSTRWNGEQAKADCSNERDPDRRSARAGACGVADADRRCPHSTQWVDAYALRETQLADFYFKRFREEFRPAITAWIATQAAPESPDAPLTPFAMPEYRAGGGRGRSTAGPRRRGVRCRGSGRNIQRASNYVLAVVLFTVSLFFASMSTKLGAHRLRAITVALGCVLFLGTAIWIATFPVSLAV